MKVHGMGNFRSKRMPETYPLLKSLFSYFLNRSPETGRNRSDTVGEIAGLAESSTYVGKSARIVASIRTETGSLWVDSSGGRNTLREGVAMRAGRRRSDRALRAVLPGSPGRPGVAQRENRRRFWA